MRPLLIDTNAYAGFKRGDRELVTLIQHVERIAISPVMLGELLAGFNDGNRARQNHIQLQEFLESSRVKVYPITSDTAHFYSQIYESLKKKGKPIPTNDMWIAAHAFEHGCILCTYDKHFHEMDGLLIATSIVDFY